jgi:hypothetical protein
VSERTEPRRTDASGGESPRLTIFMRGLTIGALVGAAIAGSAIWERVRRDRNTQAEGQASDGATARTDPDGPALPD